MGFDIYGNAPRSEAGRYFAANWTAWRDLAGLCSASLRSVLADR